MTDFSRVPSAIVLFVFDGYIRSVCIKEKPHIYPLRTITIWLIWARRVCSLYGLPVVVYTVAH